MVVTVQIAGRKPKCSRLPARDTQRDVAWLGGVSSPDSGTNPTASNESGPVFEPARGRLGIREIGYGEVEFAGYRRTCCSHFARTGLLLHFPYEFLRNRSFGTAKCSDLGEILWQNAIAEIALGWTTGKRIDRARNIVWQWFTEPALRACFPEEDWPRHSLAHVNDLRATYSRRGSDPDVADLVHRLRTCSAEFRDLWERHEVAVHRFDRKRFLHPEVGVLHLTCEVLLSPEADTKVLAFFPTEGTDAREKLELLRAIGAQEFRTLR